MSFHTYHTNIPNPMTAITQKKTGVKPFLTGALAAGLIGAVLNNLYSYLYTALTGFSVLEVINFGSVTISSFVPAVLGALFYFVLSRFTAKATRIFVVVGIVLIIASFAGSFMPQLPDGTPTPAGFVGLTLPMHIIAGAVILWVLTRYVRRDQQAYPGN
jgi:hypothetical protein